MACAAAAGSATAIAAAKRRNGTRESRRRTARVLIALCAALVGALLIWLFVVRPLIFPAAQSSLPPPPPPPSPPPQPQPPPSQPSTTTRNLRLHFLHTTTTISVDENEIEFRSTALPPTRSKASSVATTSPMPPFANADDVEIVVRQPTAQDAAIIAADESRPTAEFDSSFNIRAEFPAAASEEARRAAIAAPPSSSSAPTAAAAPRQMSAISAHFPVGGDRHAPRLHASVYERSGYHSPTPRRPPTATFATTSTTLLSRRPNDEPPTSRLSSASTGRRHPKIFARPAIATVATTTSPTTTMIAAFNGAVRGGSGGHPGAHAAGGSWWSTHTITPSPSPPTTTRDASLALIDSELRDVIGQLEEAKPWRRQPPDLLDSSSSIDARRPSAHLARLPSSSSSGSGGEKSDAALASVAPIELPVSFLPESGDNKRNHLDRRRHVSHKLDLGGKWTICNQKPKLLVHEKFTCVKLAKIRDRRC